VKAYVIESILDSLVDEADSTPSEEYAILIEKFRDLIIEGMEQNTILKTLKVNHEVSIENYDSWKFLINDIK